MNPASPELPLRDIHLPAEPAWWPPAPGWWLLALLVLLLLGWALRTLWRVHRRRRARQFVLDTFDREVAAALAPVERLAAGVQVIKRVLRRDRLDLLTLALPEWLAALDRGLPDRPLQTRHRGLLEEGVYRAELPAHEVDSALQDLRRALRTLT